MIDPSAASPSGGGEKSSPHAHSPGRRRALKLLTASAAGGALLGGSLQAAAAACLPASPRANDFFAGARLHADVRQYVEHGGHRTATEGDRRTVAWLVERLRAAGCTVERQAVPVRQYVPAHHRLLVDGQTVPGAFPQWWPPEGAAAVEGRAVWHDPEAEADPPAVDGAVVMARVPFTRSRALTPERVERIRQLTEAGAAAVVLVTEGPTGEVTAFNAPTEVDPWRVPVLLAGGKHGAQLRQQAEAGATARVEMEGTYREVEAHNVLAETGRGGPSVVVSTPVSGWFTCGGERGPGIAFFLALAEWAASGEAPPARFHFAGTTAHEIGAQGFEASLPVLPGPEEAGLWCHLGAGLATWAWEEGPAGGLVRTGEVDPMRFLMGAPALAPLLQETFAGLPGLARQVYTERALGEMKYVREAGYRPYFGATAGHTFHHTPADGAQTTAPELLEPAGRAFYETHRRFLAN